MKTKNKIIFFGLLLLGFIIRAGFLVAPHMDADQAEFALQAMHIARGEFSAFSWGYAYIGTFPSFIAAVFFKLFGASRLVFNGSTFFLSFFFLWVVYATGKLVFGRRGAFLCLLLAVIAPFYQTFHCVWGRHGYLETLLFGSSVLYLTLYIIRKKGASKKIKGAVFLGLFAGIGFWTNYLIAYYFPASAFVLFMHDKKIFTKKYFYVALSCFFVGSLPFWIFNFTHDFAAFSLLLDPTPSGYGFKEALKITIEEKLPKAMGIFNANGDKGHPAFIFASGGIYIMAFVFLALRIKGILKFVFTGKNKYFKGIDIFIFFMITVVVIYARSSYIGYNTARYLLPVHSALPFVLTFMFMKLKGKKLKLVGMVMLIIMLNLNIYSNLSSWPFFNEVRYNNYKSDISSKQKLLSFARENNIATVQAFNYWISPTVTFDLKEDLICVVGMDRYAPYLEKFTADLDRGYLLVGKNSTIENTLALNNAEYDYALFGCYALYYNIKHDNSLYKVIPSSTWHVSESFSMSDMESIKDNNVSTYARTFGAQGEGYFFTVELETIKEISKVSLFLGDSEKDAPKNLLVETSVDGNTWSKAAVVSDYFGFHSSGIYLGSFPEQNIIDICFSAREAKYIRFKLKEPKAKTPYSWSVHELFIYTKEKEALYTDKDKILDSLSSYVSAGKAVYASPYLMSLLENKGAYDPFDYTRYDFKKEKYLIDTSSDFVMCVGAGLAEHVASLLDQCGLSYERKEFLAYTVFEVTGGDIWNLRWEYYLPFMAHSKYKALAFYEKGVKAEKANKYEEAIDLYRHSLKYKPWLYRGLLSLRNVLMKTGKETEALALGKKMDDKFGCPNGKRVVFDDTIELLCFNYMQNDDIVTLKYVWRCIKKDKRDIYVYVHFKDQDGNILFQQDHMPASGRNPVSIWDKGEVTGETLESTIPREHFGKKIYITLGLWNPLGSGKKLDVTYSDYEHDGNTVIVGECQ